MPSDMKASCVAPLIANGSGSMTACRNTPVTCRGVHEKMCFTFRSEIAFMLEIILHNIA